MCLGPGRCPKVAGPWTSADGARAVTLGRSGEGARDAGRVDQEGGRGGVHLAGLKRHLEFSSQGVSMVTLGQGRGRLSPAPGGTVPGPVLTATLRCHGSDHPQHIDKETEAQRD